MNGQKLARGMGWFSIALGVAEIVGANQLSRAFGLGNRAAGVLRVLGVREIGTGVAVLGTPRRAPGIWARVGGDALDLAALGSAFRVRGANRGALGVAVGAVAGAMLLDVIAGMKLSGGGGG
ncbi:MAG TPA: hypothetical protein VGR37_21535, partial [Longimicrobiaceae bacterium]|nr:hypothetical protein [Longimicrobiaceae bacterium]